MMAISGRVPLLVLLGLVPVVLRPSFGTMWLWLLAVTLVVLADWLLAPRPESLEISRRSTDPVRMTYPTSSTLLAVNPSSRTVTGVLRDAWQPTAGATANRFPLRLTPGDRVLLHTPLRPVRRGGDAARRALEDPPRRASPLRSRRASDTIWSRPVEMVADLLLPSDGDPPSWSRSS